MSEPVVKTILVADEDPIIRLLASHVLTRHNFSVDVAASKSELDEQLEQHDYDGILLDVRLLDAAEEWVRALAERRPVVAARLVLMSAGGLNDSWPVHATLRKPLELDALVETIRSASTRR